MECFNCLKCCECTHYLKKDNKVYVFCSESCSNAYQVDDLLLELENRITEVKEKIAVANICMNCEDKQYWITRKKCLVAELMFANALLKRKSKAELQQLAELVKDAMVDRLQYYSDSGNSKDVIGYSKFMKERNVDYEIDLLGR